MAQESRQSEGEGRAEAEATPDEGLRRDLRALATILGKTARAYRRPAWLEGALWYLVTLGAVVASVFLVGALFPKAVGALTSWMFVAGVVAATVGAGITAVGFVRRRRRIDQIASLLQRHNPSFRNDLVAALEFGRRLLSEGADDVEFNEAMARAHVRQTAQRAARRCENGHLAHLLPQRSLTAPAMSLAACVVLLAVPFALDADWAGEVLTSGLVDEDDGSIEEDAERRPVIGDLTIYYSAPGYTGLDREVEAFTTGHIEALVGTEITLEGPSLLEDAEQVEIVFESEQGTEKRVMETSGEDELKPKLSTSFVALEEGSYHFRATLEDGTVVVDDTERDIKLQPDKPPEVEITSHSGEVEVTPDESLEIEYEISDDFGLDSISRSWFFAGDDENADDEKIDRPELSDEPDEISGELTFDLEPLELQSKDVVVFQIEATDNNSMTGPGVGKSEPLRLRVSSPEDKHLENVQRQQEILEALVGLLGDYLERPVGERAPDDDDTWRQEVDDSLDDQELTARVERLAEVRDGQERILERFGEVADRLEDDPLMVERDLTLFNSLRKRVEKLHEEGGEVFARVEEAAERGDLSADDVQPLASHAAESEEALEKGILSFEELLVSQKMDAVEATAEDIDKIKERVRELLEKYKETEDPELKKAIKREIQRLKQRMAELTQRMQMQLKRMPEEHMNLEALENRDFDSDTQKMSDSLEQLEQKLEDDDIDGAMAALDQMSEGMEGFSEQMSEDFADAKPKGLSELDEKVSDLMDRTNDLRQAEEELEKETAELDDEMREKRKRQMEAKLEEFSKRMRQRVDEQQRALDEMEEAGADDIHREGLESGRERLEDLDEMLEDKDVEQSLERAKDALQAHRRTRMELDLSKRYNESDAQQERLERLSQMNDGVEDRGEEIVGELEEMMEQADQQASQEDRERMQKLAERQRKIGEQADDLQQKVEEGSKKHPMLKEQLGEPMQRSRESMKEASEHLEEGRGQGALDSERSALERLGELNQKMQQTLQKKRQDDRGQGRGQRREDVDIPEDSDDEESGGGQYRRDVMDAMKEEKLDDYESEIERYYKSIME